MNINEYFYGCNLDWCKLHPNDMCCNWYKYHNDDYSKYENPKCTKGCKYFSDELSCNIYNLNRPDICIDYGTDKNYCAQINRNRQLSVIDIHISGGLMAKDKKYLDQCNVYFISNNKSLKPSIHDWDGNALVLGDVIEYRGTQEEYMDFINKINNKDIIKYYV